jgi:hypothetical protein
MNPKVAQVCVAELCPEQIIVSEVCSAAIFRWILQDKIENVLCGLLAVQFHLPLILS